MKRLLHIVAAVCLLSLTSFGQAPIGYGGISKEQAAARRFTITYTCPGQTQTPNIALFTPATGTLNWDLCLNANFTTLDSLLGGASQLPGTFWNAAPVASTTLRGLIMAPNCVPPVFPSSTNSDGSWNCAEPAGGGGGGGGSDTVSPPLNLNGSNISIPQATSSANGYLSNTDWATFNGKQVALGFTPLNPANNLSELASAATARSNLGLGSAAVQAASAFDTAGAAAAVQTNLTTEVSRAEAAEATAVHLAGTETISGAKTFSSAVTLSGLADGCLNVVSNVIQSTGSACGSSGGMVYPSGTGVPFVSSGAWGSTLGTSGSGSTLALTASPVFTGSPTVPGYVPTSTTVNGHALSGNVTVAYADLGVIPSGDIPSSIAANTSGTAANLSGTPALPNGTTATTQTVGDSSTDLATDAFVQAAVPLASSTTPLMDGTAAVGTSAHYARADHVHPSDTSRVATSTTVNGHALSANVTVAPADLAAGALASGMTATTQSTSDSSTDLATDAFVKNQAYAPLASPTFTGTPAAPTPSTSDSSTKIATTAFVKAQAYAPLASPALTGTPTAPTQTTGDTSTDVATDDFVAIAVAAAAPPSVPSTPSGVTFTYAAPAGGSGSWQESGMGGRQVTSGTTDAIVDTDRSQFVIYNDGSNNVTTTVPDAGTTNFANYMAVAIANVGTGLVTLNRTTSSTINGGTSASVWPYSSCTLSSLDNANWLLRCGPMFDSSGDVSIPGTITQTGTGPSQWSGTAWSGTSVTVPSGLNFSMGVGSDNLFHCQLSSGSSCMPPGVVTSVFGRTGAVVATSGDYTAAQVTGAVPNTTTVNGHALSSNVTVAPADLAAGAFVNGMTAVTQSAGDLTADIATDGFVSITLAAALAADDFVVASGGGPTANNQICEGGAPTTKFCVYISWADLDSTDYIAGGGTAQVQTATLAPPATSLVAGLKFDYLPSHANTGAAPTLNLNGLGAKSITKFGTTALVAGDLTTTAVATVVYDGTEWQLQNPQTNTGAPAVSSVFGRTGAVTATSGDYTVSQVTGAAPLASPALTGTPTAPTQSAGDNSTNVATTAYTNTAYNLIKTSGSPFTMLGLTGYYWNDSGSTYTFQLDAPVAGKQYCFGNYSGQTGAITVKSTTSVYIVYEGTNGTVTTGTLVSGGAKGDFICMEGVDTTHYMVTGAGYGTWTNN